MIRIISNTLSFLIIIWVIRKHQLFIHCVRNVWLQITRHEFFFPLSVYLIIFKFRHRVRAGSVPGANLSPVQLDQRAPSFDRWPTHSHSLQTTEWIHLGGGVEAAGGLNIVEQYSVCDVLQDFAFHIVIFRREALPRPSHSVVSSWWGSCPAQRHGPGWELGCGGAVVESYCMRKTVSGI